jgi:hypothetical protein
VKSIIEARAGADPLKAITLTAQTKRPDLKLIFSPHFNRFHLIFLNSALIKAQPEREINKKEKSASSFVEVDDPNRLAFAKQKDRPKAVSR